MITYLKFHKPVSIGSNEIDSWSGLQSTTSALFQNIKVEDRGDKGVLLKFRAGKAEQDVEVRWSNLAQVTRRPEPEPEIKPEPEPAKAVKK